MSIHLRIAEEADLDRVLAYVRAYHEFEGVKHCAESAVATVGPLLGQSDLGRVWLIYVDSRAIGYVAICFGYSIEFSGRDAFVDEMFIEREHRGKGFGAAALVLVKAEAAALGAKVLHLEVARDNERAQRLYSSAGFMRRERFFLMSAPVESDAPVFAEVR